MAPNDIKIPTDLKYGCLGMFLSIALLSNVLIFDLIFWIFRWGTIWLTGHDSTILQGHLNKFKK